MSALSEVELARIIKQGNEEVKAFGSSLSDDDMWAVSAYLRTLAFDTAPVAVAPASTSTPAALAVTETLASTGAGTPSTAGTAVGTEQAPATNEATTVAKAGF